MKRSLLCLALFEVAAAGQAFRTPWEALFPAPEIPAMSESAGREFRNHFRVLRQGTGNDRLDKRGELIRAGDTYLAGLVGELSGGNHFTAIQAALVLMEMRDPRTVRPLMDHLARGKGPNGFAALALGKIGDPRAETVLLGLIEDNQPPWRRMGCLALGRLAGPLAPGRLVAAAHAVRQDLDQEAAILATGFTGASARVKDLREIQRRQASKDAIRRAATAALGFLGADAAGDLCACLADEDPAVRRIALEGLARGGVREGLMERIVTLRERAERRPDAAEEARWCLAIAATGGVRAAGHLQAWAAHEQSEVQAAAAAAAGFLVPGDESAALVRELMGSLNHDVSLAALLAYAHRAPGVPLLDPFVSHVDQRHRRAAVHAIALALGPAAVEPLRRLLGTEQKDDVREAAADLLSWLARDPGVVRDLCRARLQVMLDDEGLAVSWNLNASAHQIVLRVLGIENALPRGGGGASPTGTAAARAAGAVATRPSPEDEDLRRHLDRHPYMDVRESVEFR